MKSERCKFAKCSQKNVVFQKYECSHRTQGFTPARQVPYSLSHVLNPLHPFSKNMHRAEDVVHGWSVQSLHPRSWVPSPGMEKTKTANLSKKQKPKTWSIAAWFKRFVSRAPFSSSPRSQILLVKWVLSIFSGYLLLENKHLSVTSRLLVMGEFQKPGISMYL